MVLDLTQDEEHAFKALDQMTHWVQGQREITDPDSTTKDGYNISYHCCLRSAVPSGGTLGSKTSAMLHLCLLSCSYRLMEFSIGSHIYIEILQRPCCRILPHPTVLLPSTSVRQSNSLFIDPKITIGSCGPQASVLSDVLQVPIAVLWNAGLSRSYLYHPDNRKWSMGL